MYSKLIQALSRRGGEEEERDSSKLIQHIPEIEIHYVLWKKDVTLPEADQAKIFLLKCFRQLSNGVIFYPHINSEQYRKCLSFLPGK